MGGGIDQGRAAAIDHLVAADPQRLQGTGYGGFTQGPGTGDALAQADDAGKGIDHAEAVGSRSGDQQSAIIGAEVERRIGTAQHVRCQLGLIPRRPPAPGEAPMSLHARGTGGQSPDLVVHHSAFPLRRSPRSSTVTAVYTIDASVTA